MKKRGKYWNGGKPAVRCVHKNFVFTVGFWFFAGNKVDMSLPLER